jgi:phosphosulfolactate synthase
MNAFSFIASDRNKEPGTGLTMMLDKGIGLMSLIDLLELSGDYLNYAKLGWGTSAILNRDLIQEKTEIYL